ncbi:PAS domain S-box protein (plasmid) [Rhodobacteraceae bacterium SC52]|nr:PAS domain S-box protein [Rhodobacteraceae bacterium SC52]
MNTHRPENDSRALLSLTPTLILDPASDTILAANEQAIALLQLDAAQGGLFCRHLPDGPAQMVVFADEVAHRGSAWSRKVALCASDGSPLTLELRGKLLPRRDTPHLLLTFIDLKELELRARIAEAAEIQRAGLFEWHRAQAFFSELERQNQLILNAAGEGIYGVNADGKTTFVNRAAQEMLGWTAEDLLGHDIHSQIHHHHLNGDHYPSHDCPIYQSFRFEQVNRIEDEVFWRKDGRPIRVEYVSTPIYDQKVLAGAVVIFRDITERKKNERLLREAMDEVAALRDRLEQENAYLQEAIISERAHHDIIGTSPATLQVLAKIEMVSRTAANVLITGEAGTGKALVASAIHKDSDRRRRPLIHFKCGSVSPDTLDSELFGHMRGAFPGALRDAPGKLELAHGGTLYLDDVTELTMESQGQLLSALQSGEVRRLGDTRARQIDLRVIASSSRNLEREVAAGRFREDLYFYLNVFPIHFTPLRERTDDIPLLAAHLLRLACKRLNRRTPIITEGTMRTLTRYPWPGNVRELANVIERGAIVSTEGKLIVELRTGPNPEPRGTGSVLTEAEIEQMKVLNLITCLRETGGRVAGPNGAAALLGIRPTTLYSRIKTYGLSPSDWR